MVLAEIIGLAIGVPLAIACAVRSGSAFDRFMTGTAFGMVSVPTFLSAILLIYLFAVQRADRRAAFADCAALRLPVSHALSESRPALHRRGAGTGSDRA